MNGTERIALVTMPGAWGGAEVNTLLLAETLLARGHQISLIEVGPGYFAKRAAPRAGLGIVTLLPGSPATRSVTAWLSLLRQTAAGRVVLSKPWIHSRLPALDIAVRVRRLPYICIEHHPAHVDDQAPMDRRRRSWREAIAMRNVLAAQWLQRGARSGVLCVSRTVQEALARFEGWPARLARVVHPGIPVANFQPDPAGRARVRARLRISEKALVIGSLGRLDSSKRFDVALRIFAAVAAHLPTDELHFILGGEGPQASALRELAASLGVGNRVHLTGFVPEAERSAYLSAMDTWLLVSEMEGLCMSLIEAMACGCLVVATDSGGPSEILTAPTLGWLVAQDDWPGCEAAVLASLALAPEERAARIAPARRYVLEHFSAEKQNAQMADFIEAQ